MDEDLRGLGPELVGGEVGEVGMSRATTRAPEVMVAVVVLGGRGFPVPGDVFVCL